MERWIVFAFISMTFAGLTSIRAKYCLQNIKILTRDLGRGIRTTTIFVLITTFVLIIRKTEDLGLLTSR